MNYFIHVTPKTKLLFGILEKGNPFFSFTGGLLMLKCTNTNLQRCRPAVFGVLLLIFEDLENQMRLSPAILTIN